MLFFLSKKEISIFIYIVIHINIKVLLSKNSHREENGYF